MDLEAFEVLCDGVITGEVLFVLFWEVENLCIVLEVNTLIFCMQLEVIGHHIDLEVGLYGGDKVGVI